MINDDKWIETLHLLDKIEYLQVIIYIMNYSYHYLKTKIDSSSAVLSKFFDIMLPIPVLYNKISFFEKYIIIIPILNSIDICGLKSSLFSK